MNKIEELELESNLDSLILSSETDGNRSPASRADLRDRNFEHLVLTQFQEELIYAVQT